MRVVCLGWGSLIWDPRDLPLGSEWFRDGPSLPIEFSRVGDGGELATAICLDAPTCEVLWAHLNIQSLDLAVQALRDREQIPDERADGVGIYIVTPESQGVLGKWASVRGIDAVIWTDLPPRFQGKEGLLPSLGDAVSYLKSLDGKTRAHAWEYIKRVPAQIDTPYRRLIKHHLGI